MLARACWLSQRLRIPRPKLQRQRRMRTRPALTPSRVPLLTLVVPQSSSRTTVAARPQVAPSPISFPSSVTAGDVVVVAIAVYSGSVGSVGDTLGSTFTLLAEVSGSPIDVWIYDATLSSSGLDSIFVSFFGATQGGVYIYEVSGVTTVGEVYEVGGGDCYYYPPPCSPEPSTESASFQSGAFLVSLVAGTDYTHTSVVSTTAGTGFTLSPRSSGGTDGVTPNTPQAVCPRRQTFLLP